MPNEKSSQLGHLPRSTSGPLECALKGTALLNHPFFNKGSAFSKDERREFGLGGLLPSNIQTLEQQVQRAYKQYSSRENNLAKNTFLTSLKDQNAVLYYRVSGSSPRPDRCQGLIARCSSSSTTSPKCSASCILRPKAMPSRDSRASSGGPTDVS